MSSDYTSVMKVGPFKVTTPANAAVQGYIPSMGFSFNVHSLELIIQTAGAQSSGTIALETCDASPVGICVAATGTSAARTSVVAKPTTNDSDDVVPATKGLQLIYRGTTDASLVAWAYVNITPSHC